MNEFSKPAPKNADERLFERSPRALQKLQEASRKELRLKARREYWARQHAKTDNH